MSSILPKARHISLDKYQPRPYQKNILNALNTGIKRAVWVVHRRGGKDITIFNWCIYKLLSEVCTCFYILPTYSQAKKVIWDSITIEGFRFFDYIPDEIVLSKNKQELKINLVNGSTLQLIGSDNIDSLVGTNPKIIVFSEYAIQSPAAWDYLRPILDVNKGYAIFISTPRGKNHFYDLLNMAKTNKDKWFSEVLTINDTGVLNAEDMEQAKKEGMSEELVAQEFYCSFSRGVEGSYYGRLVEKARDEGRICRVPYQPRSPVNTAWDLGFGDATSIVFWQDCGGECRIIDFYENQGEMFAHYAKIVKEKPYVYGSHYFPHDGANTTMSRGETPKDVAQEMGINPYILSRDDQMLGIENARVLLSMAYIDEIKCNHMLKCLENYHKKFNEKTNSYSDTPVHDWTSHACFSGDTFVLTRNGMQRIMCLPKTGEVLTLCGWKQYENPRITKKNAQLVEVQFVDGTTVKCTPEHKFLTVNGWKSAYSLRKGLEIQSSWMRLHGTSMEACIENGQMTVTFLEVVKDYIALFGRKLSETFQKIAIFTTKMVTQTTICSATSSACHQTNICQKSGLKEEKKEQLEIHRKMLYKKQLNGIDQMKEDYGTRGMLKDAKVGQNGKENLGIVQFAQKSFNALLGKAEIRKNTAHPTAKPLLIAGIKQLDDREDVWCLTVPEYRHFSLANGAIVHNCDAFRYCANARKEFGRGPGSMTPEKLMEMKARAGFGAKPRGFNGPQQPFLGR